MWVSVSRTPATLLIRPAMTSATWSNSRTRTMAMRSTSPAVEETSLAPSRSATAAATSGIESVAASIITMAVITTAMLAGAVRRRPHLRSRAPGGPRAEGPGVGERVAAGPAAVHTGEEAAVGAGTGRPAGEGAAQFDQP